MDNESNTLTNNDNVAELISSAVGKIGENIVLRRSSHLNGNIHSYVHNSVSQGLGKIGVLLKLNSDSDQLSEIGKNLCMHIAALNPKSISEKDLSNELVNAEKEIIKQQLKDSGKPDNILEKMLEGKLKKFFEENTLLGQKFVIDPSLNVEDYIKQSAEKNNCNISVEQFIRYELGS
jgi:elongation factor Ts